MSINKFNCEGYYDPTAYEAMSAVEKEEKALRAFRPIVYIPATLDRHTGIPSDMHYKRRVAGYARVSTDSEEQLTSYEAQVDYYTQYIKANPEWQFVAVYTDEGISATNTKHRDGFNRMVQDALDGKIEIKTAELIQFDFSGAAKF